MAEAVGIHDHDFYKTGLAPTDPAKPILAIDDVLHDVTVEEVPKTEDRYAGVTFTMGGNDNFGTCGPTSLANNRASTTKVATGAEKLASDTAIFALYKTQNPNFVPNPANPVEDNGVEMGSLLDAARKVGLDGDKLVAFGRAKAMDDASLERLVAIFGGVLFAVDLETAQQAQTDATPPVWDYKKSGEWGGHAIACGKYRVETTVSGLVVLEAPVISWKMEVGTTDAFRSHQLEEVWVPIWQWHLEHPAFLAGVDTTRFAADFKELTGEALPISPPSPTPGPTPTPSGDPADVALEAATRHWRRDERHVGDNKKAATAVEAWVKAKALG